MIKNYGYYVCEILEILNNNIIECESVLDNDVKNNININKDNIINIIENINNDLKNIILEIDK